jgi:hypothetical protein
VTLQSCSVAGTVTSISHEEPVEVADFAGARACRAYIDGAFMFMDDHQYPGG